MRPTNYLPQPWLLLGAAASASFFATPVFAQDTNTNTNNNNPPPAQPTDNNNSSAQPSDAAPTDAQPSDAQSSDLPQPSLPNQEPEQTSTDEPAAPSSQTQADETSTDEPPPPETTDNPETSTTEDSEPTTTDEPSTTDAVSTTDVPPPPANTNTDGGFLTDAPTITRAYGVPTYAPATVPPTNNAPFMQHSRAPDGTVFIAVGAILGAFALGLLLWRVIVSFLLHRSVERAAMAQHDVNIKSGFPAPPAPFYKYTDQGSQMSFGASPQGRGTRRTTRGPTPSAAPSNANLFFSPTAAGAQAGGNRSSTFLPSGFYAAGPSPGGAHDHSISLTNLRPDSRGNMMSSRNGMNPSPPDSPGNWPQRRDMSASSLNLALPANQRAPSAYLEDLLADDPGALPPPNMLPSSGQRPLSSRRQSSGNFPNRI